MIAVVLSCVTASVVALPAGAAAETIAWRANGEVAAARFVRVDGCMTTWLGLSASDVRSFDNQRTTFPPNVYVHLQRHDPCTFGWRWTTDLVPLPAGALIVRGDLGSATLRTTVPFDDQTTGATVPLQIDLAWEATSPVRRVSFGHHVIVDGVHVTGSDLRVRGADVSGSVSAGSETWTIADVTDGELSSMHFGSIAIDR